MRAQDVIDGFLAASWHAVFWDEAHILKNHRNQTYEAASMLETPYRCKSLALHPLTA